MSSQQSPFLSSSSSNESDYDSSSSSWSPDDNEGTTPNAGQQTLEDCNGEDEHASPFVQNPAPTTQDAPTQSNSVMNDEITRQRPTRRQYTYHTRVRREPRKYQRQDKWMQAISCLTEPKLRRTKCCKTLKCFRHVNYQFYLERTRQILSASKSTRRTILKSLLGSDNKFSFDGRIVCNLFLKKSFHFSSLLLSEVAGRASTTSSSSLSSGRVSARHFSSGTLACSTNDDEPLYFLTKKKEAIISFIERVAEDCGDSMPHKSEVHLPFHQRRELYPIFVAQFNKLYPSMDPASPHYFRTIWRHECGHIKVMKSCRFTVCEKCDEIRRSMKDAIVNDRSTSILKEQRKNHVDFILAERIYYQKKKDRARLHSSEYCSIIIDGADQSAFGLPHFTTTPKSQRGHAMKVKLIGLLEHAIQNKLTFLTMTEDHATGANHVIEVIHRFLTSKRLEGPLPPMFFVQLDNCSRENKNRFVMGYCEMLVALSVFESVEVGFLPVGHTHEDVDQAFSQTSRHLRFHNAITLSDLHSELMETNKREVKVQHMQRVANFSGLCEEEKCLRKVNRITQWRYFLFTLGSNENIHTSEHSQSGPLPTVCHVKENNSEKWEFLFKSTGGGKPGGILRQCPDLRKTPPLKISCPDGVDNVTKRFCSEEGRVNDIDKMIELHKLRDFVFRSRTDPFHWDLKSSPETEYCGLYKSSDNNGNNHSSEPSENVRDNNTGNHDDSETAKNQDNNDEQINDHCKTVNNPDNDTVKQGDVDTEIDRDNQRDIDVLDRNTHAPQASQVGEQPISKVDYQINSFVIVRHTENRNDTTKFWVAKVVEVFKQSNCNKLSAQNSTTPNFAFVLKVHWYDRSKNDSRNLSQAQFYPCYHDDRKSSKKLKVTRTTATRSQLGGAMCDKIDTDTVLVSFSNLTKRHTLPLSVQRKLT